MDKFLSILLLCVLLWASPAAAQAGALPAALAADALVEREANVLAELHKVAGAGLRLALPAGRYTLVLRQGRALLLCELSLQDGQVTRVAANGCRALSEVEAHTKGYFSGAPAESRPAREIWGIELGFGLGSFAHDDYTRRLQDFGFSEQIFAKGSALRLSAALSRQLAPHLSVLAEVRTLDGGHYNRDLLSTAQHQVTEHFDWSSYALGVQLRAHTDFFGDKLRLYAQLGPGLGYTHSSLKGHGQDFFGPVLAASGGLFFMPWRHVGVLAQATYSYAPILANELGEHHDDGGIALLLGVRYRSWGTP